jgi:hypothetical protein
VYVLLLWLCNTTGPPVRAVSNPAANSSTAYAANSSSGSGGEFPAILLGVVNPIFLKTLHRWPNAILLQGAGGHSASSHKRGSRYFYIELNIV